MIKVSPKLSPVGAVQPTKYLDRLPNGSEKYGGWFDWTLLAQNLLSQMPENTALVEVGVYQGRSAVYMHEWLRENRPEMRFKHFLIDLFTPVPRVDGAGKLIYKADGSPLYDFENNELFFILNKLDPNRTSKLERYLRGALIIEDGKPVGFRSKISFQEGESHKLLRQFDPNEIGLLYIDGDHSALGCYRDICGGVPNIKPGGACVIHDYHTASCPEVTSAIDLFAADNPDLEIFAYKSEIWNTPENNNDTVYFYVPEGYKFVFREEKDFLKNVVKFPAYGAK